MDDDLIHMTGFKLIGEPTLPMPVCQPYREKLLREAGLKEGFLGTLSADEDD